MQRSFFLVASVLLASATSHAAAGDACVVADFDRTCTGSTLTVCVANAAPDQANGIETALDCKDSFVDPADAATADQRDETLTCAAIACDGAGCPTDLDSCLGNGADATCIGILPGIIGVAQNNFGLGCTAGFSCELVDNTGLEKCVPTLGDGCDPAELNTGCVGNVATRCLSGAINDQPLAFTDAAGVDCAGFGGTCSLEDIGSGDAPVCVGLPLNSLCDDVLMRCDEALLCTVQQQQNGVTISVCSEPTAGEGEGEGEVAGEGEGEGRDDTDNGAAKSGCSATGVMGHGAPASLAAVGLLGLFFAFRRRR